MKRTRLLNLKKAIMLNLFKPSLELQYIFIYYTFFLIANRVDLLFNIFKVSLGSKIFVNKHTVTFSKWYFIYSVIIFIF